MTRGAAALAGVSVCALLAGCGGGSGNEDAAVRSAVQSYFKAITARDGAAACGTLTEASRERIGEFATKLGQPRGSGCAGTMRAFFASGAMAQLEAAGDARILKVTRNGASAKVRVDGVGTPLALRRAGSAWRIDFAPAVEADKVP